MVNTGSVKIDGKEYTNVQDNRITVSGVTYNLLNAEKDKVTTISVSQDTSAIIDTVKSFVEEYNKVLDNLQEKYSTKTWSTDDLDNDYEPLTKTQQAGMTSDQIESWNEKAKSGLLYHNSMIRDLINDMRDAISTRVTSVNSEYNSASAIGITSSDNKGHLTLNEDKLKKALAADPDCVYQIFANDQDNYTDLDPNKRYDYIKSEDYNARGIVNRLLSTGFVLAVFMANSGGAWDNAKKYVEEGNFGGKGSENHKATVVGDTVGDPFKDTSGPSLNILIKLMSMVSIVMAGLTVTCHLL